MSDELQTRAALEAIGALSKRLTTMEAQTRADAARKPDDDRKRADDDDRKRPDDDTRKRDDSPLSPGEIRAMMAVLQRHLAEMGEGEESEEEEGESTADDDDDTRRARRRDAKRPDDDKELPRRTASDSDDDKVHSAQHRHDSVLSLHGVRADRPRVMESSTPYRLRLCKQAQRLLPVAHPLRRADFSLIRDAVAFDQTEAQLLEAVKSAAYDPAHNVAPGVLREVVETDRSGRRISRWIGDVSVTLAPFRSPPQRARINRPADRPYNNL